MRRVAPARLDAIARSLLDASTLFSIATVTPGGKAHVSTAYFACSDRFDLVWLSDPSATHSRNLSGSASVAAAVYDSNQSWGGSDRGIQLFGAGRELDGAAAREAERTYAARFPARQLLLLPPPAAARKALRRGRARRRRFRHRLHQPWAPQLGAH
jgi:uncharacterized protein YhbP (UPF0306 family)